jgi:hypothetical protein
MLIQTNRSVDQAIEAGAGGVDFFLGPSEPVLLFHPPWRAAGLTWNRSRTSFSMP